MSDNINSSPSSCCFNHTTTSDHYDTVEPLSISGNPHLTTCLYNTALGLFALTWSRNIVGRSLHLHLLLHNACSTSSDQHDNHLSFPSLSTPPSFHLDIKPFFFYKKHGSKKLRNDNISTNMKIQIFWDLSRAKFGSGPEPKSRFYIAVVIDGAMTLLVGDTPVEAYAKTKAQKPEKNQVMVLRREHVYGNRLYTTKANFSGKERDISIDCRLGDDPSLSFYVDSKRVLQVKHLKWKFRGNGRIEIDGVNIQVSWDIYNWLFEDNEDGFALFMFKFEKLGFEDDEEDEYFHQLSDKNSLNLWAQQSCGLEYETQKMRKGLLRSARSSSSSSLSSASSSCSSVLEWASVEENELKGPSGFSLLVYAWKR